MSGYAFLRPVMMAAALAPALAPSPVDAETARGDDADAARRPGPHETTPSEEGLWPGFDAADPDPGNPGNPGAQFTARGMLAVLRGEIAGGGDDDLARELGTADRIAQRFRAWAGSRLALVPEILDAEEPAPPAWVERQLPKTLREEARLLAAGLEAGRADEAAELATRLVRLRYRRVAMSHAADVARWRREEIRDGLALYTVHAALTRGAATGASSRLASMMRARLLRGLRSAASGENVAFDPETSGFATALLLDRTRQGWRTLLVERGSSLDVLLAGPPRNFGNRPAGP